MQHYFIETTHNTEDYFEFSCKIHDTHFVIKSCDNIFSKDELDLGSKTLIETVLDKVELSGKGLDFGCGYGIVGMAITKFTNLPVDFADINNTALQLTKENLTKNGIKHLGKFIKTDNFEKVTENYDFIVTNPPIKTGKKLLFSIMENCFKHLNKNGSLTLVIRKDHGEESLKKHLINVFGNCEVLKRNKGFYILHCIKNS